MEHFWSPAVATGGNLRSRVNLEKPGKPLATACHRLPPRAHGKEGVDDPSPRFTNQSHSPRLHCAAALEYALEYRTVSEPCISLQFVATPNPHSFSTMQPRTARCSYPARTFNPLFGSSNILATTKDAPRCTQLAADDGLEPRDVPRLSRHHSDTPTRPVVETQNPRASGGSVMGGTGLEASPPKYRVTPRHTAEGSEKARRAGLFHGGSGVRRCVALNGGDGPGRAPWSIRGPWESAQAFATSTSLSRTIGGVPTTVVVDVATRIAELVEQHRAELEQLTSRVERPTWRSYSPTSTMASTATSGSRSSGARAM